MRDVTTVDKTHITRHDPHLDHPKKCGQILIDSRRLPRCSNKKRLLVILVLTQVIVVCVATKQGHLTRLANGTKKLIERSGQSLYSIMNHSGHIMTTADPHAGHHMMDVDHSQMDHGSMDHSSMDHGSMDHGSMDHGSSHHHGSGGHEMKMYFHISYDATILFESWTVNSWQGMLWSCIVIFIMATLYEGLKVLREYLLHKFQHTVMYEVNGKQPLATSEEVEITQPRTTPSVSSLMCSISHLIQTLLHVAQIVLSYFLMLIFMTYNFYLCLAVSVGAGMGYFLFSWKRTTIIDINEHCH